MAKKQKNRLNVVYSTNPNFSYELENEEEQEIVPFTEQTLYVSIDRKNRGGKEVTLVEGFVGSDDAAKEIGKTLKTKCGVGGSVKDNEIIVQGNFRDKIVLELQKMGFKVKKKGG